MLNATIRPYIAVLAWTLIVPTGDEDGFVKMWDNRQGETSIMTFKR